MVTNTLANSFNNEDKTHRNRWDTFSKEELLSGLIGPVRLLPYESDIEIRNEARDVENK
ncbi:MAG: hypothetical protein KJ706_09610 [Candidatus Omnitrophica bacterium]|nr:hypothetical protein [Candidatus Omnitrophota bacterium]